MCKNRKKVVKTRICNNTQKEVNMRICNNAKNIVFVHIRIFTKRVHICTYVHMYICTIIHMLAIMRMCRYAKIVVYARYADMRKNAHRREVAGMGKADKFSHFTLSFLPQNPYKRAGEERSGARGVCILLSHFLTFFSSFFHYTTHSRNYCCKFACS